MGTGNCGSSERNLWVSQVMGVSVRNLPRGKERGLELSRNTCGSWPAGGAGKRGDTRGRGRGTTEPGGRAQRGV